MKLRVGILGLGLMGDIQVSAFQSHVHQTDVVAICDTDSQRAQECAAKYNVPRSYTDGLELIAKEKLDLLCICTPPDSHNLYTLAGLRHGCNIVCEKPTAMNISEAKQMLQAAQTAGVTHVIDHELRFNGNRARIKELIDAGYIGSPRHAVVVQTNNSLINTPWTWWSTTAMGGGALGEFASHAIDLLRWWMGDVAHASGEVHTFITSRPDTDGKVKTVDSDDYLSFSLHFASGARALGTMSGVAGYPGLRHIEVNGDEGALLIDENERLWGYQTHSNDPEELTVEETIPSLVGFPGDIWSPAFVRLAQGLVTAILNGEPLQHAATFHDGLHVQRVLDQVRESSAQPT